MVRLMLSMKSQRSSTLKSKNPLKLTIKFETKELKVLSCIHSFEVMIV